MTEANTVIISRQIRENILGNLFRGKAILIMGPRQCGKTTLLNSLIDSEESVLYLNCDDLSDRNAGKYAFSLINLHKFSPPLFSISEFSVQTAGACLKRIS